MSPSRYLKLGDDDRRDSVFVPPGPPLELRDLVGQTDIAHFDNASGAPICEGVPESAWRSYFDFGCGCGRTATPPAAGPRPGRYVGVDLHAGMIRWCREHLAPLAEGPRRAHELELRADENLVWGMR